MTKKSKDTIIVALIFAIILFLVGWFLYSITPSTNYNWAVIQIGNRAIEGSIKNYHIFEGGTLININFEDGNSYTTNTENVTLTNN